MTITKETEMASALRYAEKVREVLLAADINGISQHELNQRTRTHLFGASDLAQLLDDWRHKRWVDLFVNPHNTKRPVKIWRASKLLLQDWPKVSFDFKMSTGGENSLRD